MPISLAITLGTLLCPSLDLKDMSSWISFLIGAEAFGCCLMLLLQEYCNTKKLDQDSLQMFQQYQQLNMA
jgi:hypothetical protein